MRNSFIFTTFLCSVFMLQGQSTNHNIAKGDVLVLGKPVGSTYTAVDFPRRNIIIKRGAVANFTALIGERIIVEQLETDKNGNTTVTLKRKNNMNFFRFFPRVKADLSKALESGELKTTS